MLDAYDLLMSMKKAALEAVAASKPADLLYGTVIGTAPLSINVEQKMTLTAKQLVLTRNVTDHMIEMTVDHLTEPALEKHSHEHSLSGNTEEVDLKHSHPYKGRKGFIVHNGLAVGEEVLLMRRQGGQEYIVLDRVVKA